jgi:carboxyl-terminal processing protease
MGKKTILWACGIGLVCLSVAFTSPTERYFEIAKNLDIFATLFKEVNALYVEEVNPNTLVKTGIDAMLESLDPYTNYIPENMVEDFRKLNTGQYDGIGVYTLEMDNRTVITMVIEGHSAHQAGIKIGDEILKIGSVDLSKISYEQEGQLMKGQIGTTVNLTIKRMGVANPITVDCKREKIKISNIPYYGMLQPTVGYIQLLEFTPDAGKEVKNAVVALKEQGATSLILDLRGNPGGLLFEAVNICNIFLPRGKLVVATKGKIVDQNQNYETLSNPVDTQIPLTVLINRGSASASEIVAGTLQDYDRAVIVGERSYGKGLVQVSRPLSYNSQLKVTTAKYYTPTGRCIQVLDYSHRRGDGSVGAIPDSIKQSFKTSTGRIVYDGGGIDPDIKTEPNEMHPVTRELYRKGFIFDYVTQYAYKHQTIADARNFSLTPEEYQEFAQWMKGKKYSYQSPLEQELQALTQTAKREKYYTELKPQLDQLQAKVDDSRKNELHLYKDQIKRLLEEDIASRYYLARGSAEAGFKYDTDLKKAIEVLQNQAQFKKILNQQ